MKFSQKKGYTPVRDKLQIESIDQRLETRLWNDLSITFFSRVPLNDPICEKIWTNFFFKRIDELPHVNTIVAYTKNWYFESEWFEKYDFLEFMSLYEKYIPNMLVRLNTSLSTEMSGYRIINKEIVQITAEEEINEIENALANSSKWNSVSTHLSVALKYLSDRNQTDYRNSIKESISAVEAICAILFNDDKIKFSAALAELEKKHKIHKAMKNAFSALYGYASDSGGIRHKLLEDDINVKMEDAKFMLITCSAFINYLKAKF